MLLMFLSSFLLMYVGENKVWQLQLEMILTRNYGLDEKGNLQNSKATVCYCQ